jgi:hypothetical protein
MWPFMSIMAQPAMNSLAYRSDVAVTARSGGSGKLDKDAFDLDSSRASCAMRSSLDLADARVEGSATIHPFKLGVNPPWRRFPIGARERSPGA